MPRFLTVAEWGSRAGGAERLLHLARQAGEGGGDPTTAAARLAQALADTEGEVVGYLSPRYGDLVPTTPEVTVDALKGHVANLATWVLVRSRGDLLNEVIVTSGKAAVDWLSKVSRGLVDLGLASAPAVDQGGAQLLMLREPCEQRFGGGGLDEW